MGDAKERQVATRGKEPMTSETTSQTNRQPIPYKEANSNNNNNRQQIRSVHRKYLGPTEEDDNETRPGLR